MARDGTRCHRHRPCEVLVGAGAAGLSKRSSETACSRISPLPLRRVFALGRDLCQLVRRRATGASFRAEPVNPCLFSQNKTCRKKCQLGIISEQPGLSKFSICRLSSRGLEHGPHPRAACRRDVSLLPRIVLQPPPIDRVKREPPANRSKAYASCVTAVTAGARVTRSCRDPLRRDLGMTV
jgi:hypothetical protein